MDYEALAAKLAAKLAESHEHEARVTQGRKKANAFWHQFSDALTLGIGALNKAMQLEDAFTEMGTPSSSRSAKKSAVCVRATGCSTFAWCSKRRMPHALSGGFEPKRIFPGDGCR